MTKCPTCGFIEGEPVKMLSSFTRADGTLLGEVHGKIEAWEFGCHIAMWDELGTATQMPNVNVKHDDGAPGFAPASQIAESKLPLLFIVNGEEIPLEVPPDEILGAVIWHALEKSKNTGRPDSDWEARRANGTLLDRLASIRELELTPRELVFLTLTLGFGG